MTMTFIIILLYNIIYVSGEKEMVIIIDFLFCLFSIINIGMINNLTRMKTKYSKFQ